jgi:hypothetical protein
MPDIPNEAVQAAAEALGAHRWNSYPRAAHREHNFDSACMVCRANLEPITRVVLEAAVDALAGAGQVVVSAEDLRTYVVDEEPLFSDYVSAQARLRAALPGRSDRG